MPDDPKMEANKLAIDALKQLQTLAAAVLALTITFIKDALGDARSVASLVFLIPIAWGLLTITIWTAWVSIPDALRQLGTGTNDYVFKTGRPRNLALMAQWSFALAIASLALFAIWNFPLFFSKATGIELKK
jgi:hypothetical protein